MTATPLTAQNMTSDGNQIDKAAKDTYRGMASWAGIGPDGKLRNDGKTCRECKHWASLLKADYSYDRGKGPAPLQDHYCHKRRDLGYPMGEAFPHYAKACKYFEQNPNPPRPAR